MMLLTFDMMFACVFLLRLISLTRGAAKTSGIQVQNAPVVDLNVDMYQQYKKDDPIIIKLREVGRDMRIFKFFTVDPRLAKSPTFPLMPTLMKRFPTFPIDQIPMDMEEYCTRGAVSCIEFANDALTTKLKNITEYRAFLHRIGLMYYLCYFTMLQQPVLLYFFNTCKVEKDKKYFPDFRDQDKEPYQCALFSFCPDPCCGFIVGDVVSTYTEVTVNVPPGITDDINKCGYYDEFPCGVFGPACFVEFRTNLDFTNLIKSKINTSCNCGRYAAGYVWSEDARMCVDYDECRYGSYECEQNSVCRNLPGDYYCTCSFGYVFDDQQQACVKDDLFELDDQLLAEAGISKQKQKGKSFLAICMITY